MQKTSTPTGFPWFKMTISLSTIAAATIGIWFAVDKLDASTIRVIAGFLLGLFSVLVVGALFIGKDVVQAYLIRRAIREDDIDEMQKMAFVASLSNSRGAGGNVSLSLPDHAAPQLAPPVFDGQYRDATAIEVE